MSDLDSISGQFWQELAGFSMNFISKIADFSPFLIKIERKYLNLAHFWPFLRENQLFLPENWDKIFDQNSRKTRKKHHFLTFSLVFSSFYRENFIVKVPPFTWKFRNNLRKKIFLAYAYHVSWCISL